MMTAILLVGLSVSYGLRAVIQKQPSSSLPFRAVVLQPNIPQEEKFDPASEDLVLQKLGRLMDLANAIGPSPDLIVWPEAATPRGMFADEINHSFTLNQARQAKAPLLIGTLEPLSTEPDGGGEFREYNSAVLLGENDAPFQSYRKRHIGPFGEFLPFRDWLPEAICQLVPGDLAPGKEANLLFLKKPAVRLGALICFEDSLARETRALVREGAQLLVNLTNDSWFGTSAGAAQHLANAKFRAIEARLPLIRCANTGETCSVDPIGRVDQRLAPFTEGIDTLLVQVPEHPIPTSYTRFGDLWVIACAIAALMLARRTHAKT
jgi:apolipoprotein N-acyltransferase